MHPVEIALYFSGCLLPTLFIAQHPLHYLFSKFLKEIAPAPGLVLGIDASSALGGGSAGLSAPGGILSGCSPTSEGVHRPDKIGTVGPSPMDWRVGPGREGERSALRRQQIGRKRSASSITTTHTPPRDVQIYPQATLHGSR